MVKTVVNMPYLVKCHPDIAVGVTDRAGPPPYASQHSLVKREQESLRQHVPSPAKSPDGRIADILLFRLVELGARGNMRQEQLPSFVRIQQGFVGILREKQWVAHCSSQSRLPSFSRAFANCRTSAALA